MDEAAATRDRLATDAGGAGDTGFAVEARPSWHLPPARVGRAENVALSRCGTWLVVVDAERERVHVHERTGAAAYGDLPAFTLAGADGGLAYPHDADLSPDGRWLVVASRTSRSLTGYRRRRGSPVAFDSRPRWRLKGRRSRLGYCDGVRFVPPDGRLLAAVSLAEHRVTIFRKRLLGSRYPRRPWQVIEGAAHGLVHPDGLAFSSDGSLLAVANHGGGTVTIHARARARDRFGSDPVATLGAGALRCPHSLAFSPDGTHLAVTEAGGRSVRVWRREGDGTFTERPTLAVDATPPGGAVVGGEGGPKGVAIARGLFAVCSPEVGVRVHRAG